VDHYCEFPFEEQNRYDTMREALGAGWLETQIWSVVVHDDEDNTWTYGPTHHYVNVMHFTATKEHHDGNTYYHESGDY